MSSILISELSFFLPYPFPLHSPFCFQSILRAHFYCATLWEPWLVWSQGAGNYSVTLKGPYSAGTLEVDCHCRSQAVDWCHKTLDFPHLSPEVGCSDITPGASLPAVTLVANCLCSCRLLSKLLSDVHDQSA